MTDNEELPLRRLRKSRRQAAPWAIYRGFGMPRRATLLAAAGVILVGLAGAMLFRRDPAALSPTAEAAGEVLVRRRATGQGDTPTTPQVIRHVETPPTVSPAARPLSAPVAPDVTVNPYSVAARYSPVSPQTPQLPSSSASFTPPPDPPAAVEAQPPPVTPPAPVIREQIHIVVDGDTLTDLAELYLGSGRRYTEIFDANREVLQHPDLLPIGARLRIPGDGTPVAQPRVEEQNLAPIPRNAWRRGRGAQP